MEATVKQFEGKNGAVKNHFLITTETATIFQSYDSIIAKKEGGKIYLDEALYNYSKTTSKYLNQFLGCNDSKQFKSRLKEGKYILTNLNN